MAETSTERSQSLQSLERGMAVIQVFSRERPALTLSEVARLTDMTRATARRILLTLENLGHVRSDGRLFHLTPRVLSLGWAYLSSLDLWEVAQPLMEELVDQTKESCSAATLDLPDVVYVLRIPTRRIMTISLSVGSRLPAHPTAMGRILLAGLPDEDLDEYVATTPLEPYTERTITDPAAFRDEIERVRERGWAFVDQELEIGLRSIAAPISGHDGRTIAALNTSASAPRASVEDFHERFLPALLETADAISTSLRRTPAARLIQDSSGSSRRRRAVKDGETVRA
jgi:IclR family pca regulon transcriptional regulator